MEAGADAIVTPCPLCHLSLDAWQSKLRETTGKDFAMPILHLSQLIGVAAGLPDSALKFKRHVVSVDPVLEKLEALGWPDAPSSRPTWSRATRPTQRARWTASPGSSRACARGSASTAPRSSCTWRCGGARLDPGSVGAVVQAGVADYLERMDRSAARLR